MTSPPKPTSIVDHSSLPRRQFLQTTAALGIGYWVAAGAAAQESQSPNERLRMACIGVSGKGASDSDDAARFGDIVAICDIDERRLAGRAQGPFEKAARFSDYRKMLDALGSSIDAVTVSTPDHTHAPAALMAMRMGKHCFCQKPLTRTLYEARLMGQVARDMKVATQMGNQGTADSKLRRAAAWLKAGVVGTVREVHVWTNRPIWPQGIPRPEPTACPPHISWNDWLGVAPERPYAEGYHDFKWRGWWDFGTGALGDMGCHEINMAFMGLELRDPISVQAETSGHNRDSMPAQSIVTYQFAANAWRPAIKMVWYDGGHRPSAEVCNGREVKDENYSLVIGDKGRLWDYSELTDGAEKQAVDFVKSPGHFEEWIAAIRGGAPAMSNFPDYAGPLTETVLAGNLAVWLADKPGPGPLVQWDAKQLRVTNLAGLEPIIKPTYRAGHTLDV